MKLSDDEWRKRLSKEEYRILRKKETEPSFSGEYWDMNLGGVYACAGCNSPLFSSEEKYDSGTGWPSFYSPIGAEAVETATDYDLGYARTEVHCKTCGGHLGHVFNDGPRPTGKRYCINSNALHFEEGE